jgi:hypothetical protein
MKNLKLPLLLLATLALLLPTTLFGFGSAFVVMQGGVGESDESAAPASGVYRPDGDISLGDWYDSDVETTNLYLEIDDAVTSPTAGDGVAIRDYSSGTTYEVSIANITGSITTLRVYFRAFGDGSSITVDVALTPDGSTWEIAQTSDTLGNYTHSWHYKDFSVTTTDTSDLRVRFLDATGTVHIDTVYVEANP